MPQPQRQQQHLLQAVAMLQQQHQVNDCSADETLYIAPAAAVARLPGLTQPQAMRHFTCSNELTLYVRLQRATSTGHMHLLQVAGCRPGCTTLACWRCCGRRHEHCGQAGSVSSSWRLHSASKPG